MKSYKREKGNFAPISFLLVSNQDHRTPVPGRTLGYLINVRDGGFRVGVGEIHERSGGFYDLTLGDDGKQSVDPIPPTTVAGTGFSKAYFQSGSRLVLIPATGGSQGTDAVYFRVDDVPNQEVAPIVTGNPALLVFAMISDEDHVSLKSAAFPVVTISRDGSPFQTNFGTTYEIGMGFYAFSMFINPVSVITSQNQEVVYMLKAIAVGADVTYESFQVFQYCQPA